MEKIKIRAVHEHDLDKFLDDLGFLEQLEKGELNCYFCGCKITRENFRCVFPLEDDIKFCCSKLECYLKVEKTMKGEENTNGL